MKVKSESEVGQSCLTLATPRTAAYQAPPSMGFSRRKWSGLPLPLPKNSLHLSSVKHKNYAKLVPLGEMSVIDLGNEA